MNNWEFWIDHNISPIIAKWIMEETKITAKSFSSLNFTKTDDAIIYDIARKQRNVIIISKDIDFREMIGWKGAPPKIIFIKIGNCSSKTLWSIIKKKLPEANTELAYGNLDIFDID